jgi:hypothetical protein
MQRLDINNAEHRIYILRSTGMNKAETDRVRKINTEPHRVPARARQGTDMTAKNRNTAKYRHRYCTNTAASVYKPPTRTIQSADIKTAKYKLENAKYDQNTAAYRHKHCRVRL